MKVSAIIVHWNTPSELKAQISNFKVQKEVEVIVIDNNSKRSKDLLYCIESIKQKKFKLIQNTDNVGFAKACNQGAKIAKGEWLLFLNPDTLISSDEILRFIKNTEENRIDAASPEQKGEEYFKPLPTWFSLAIEFSPLRRIVPLTQFKKRTLFGGCLLIKSSVLKKLGWWDERFFLWFEDSDLTKRLYDMNYKINWLPVEYEHSGGSSFAKLDSDYKKKVFFNSMVLYSKKHFNLFGKAVVKLLTIINKV